LASRAQNDHKGEDLVERVLIKGRWALPAHRDEAFGRDYVSDQMAEPDYDAAIHAARRAAGGG
jgi:hypothetical protein